MCVCGVRGACLRGQGHVRGVGACPRGKRCVRGDRGACLRGQGYVLRDRGVSAGTGTSLGTGARPRGQGRVRGDSPRSLPSAGGSPSLPRLSHDASPTTWDWQVQGRPVLAPEGKRPVLPPPRRDSAAAPPSSAETWKQPPGVFSVLRARRSGKFDTFSVETRTPLQGVPELRPWPRCQSQRPRPARRGEPSVRPASSLCTPPARTSVRVPTPSPGRRPQPLEAPGPGLPPPCDGRAAAETAGPRGWLSSRHTSRRRNSAPASLWAAPGWLSRSGGAAWPVGPERVLARSACRSPSPPNRRRGPDGGAGVPRGARVKVGSSGWDPIRDAPSL